MYILCATVFQWIKMCNSGPDFMKQGVHHNGLWSSAGSTAKARWLIKPVNYIRLTELSGRPTGMSEGLKLYWGTFFLYTVLSSGAVHGHQMYSGGSIVGKASLIDPEISTTPPLIFTGCQKVRNLASFTSFKSEPPAFEIAAKYLNCETNLQPSDDRPMFSPSLVKLDPCTPKAVR